MRAKRLMLTSSILLACGPVFAAGCSAGDASLSLPRDASKLFAHTNSVVCVRGVISNDDNGVYILLTPYLDEDGTISPSPSRIWLDAEHRDPRLSSLKDGSRYRICGALRDATPWPACEDDECRWYTLENARVR